jgi:phytoene dehydrogenase-like protein
VQDKGALVVGSGPNGLSAAIVLARAGLHVDVLEASSQIGGGASSAEITLPGFVHDLGSAVHPLGVSSPFFSRLRLARHGLQWLWSPAELAHPLDDGSAVMLYRDVDRTAAQFGSDGPAWKRIFAPLARDWEPLVQEVFQPLHIPNHPLLMARFGMRGALPASVLAKSAFRSARARALFGGVAAHSALPLDAPLSSAFGLVLAAAGHAVGWPIPQGGAQSITNALAGVLSDYGGQIRTDAPVSDLSAAHGKRLALYDVTPRQFLDIARGCLPNGFRRAMEGYLYGPGIFKVDWALRCPIPWRAKECLDAITVHLGSSFDEIAQSERLAWENKPPERPFVLLAQPTLFDPTRAPAGRHVAWAYCHVPNGWRGSALQQIENQIERFAPGFRDCVLARSARTAPEMQQWNGNLVGGDVNAGAFTVKQFVCRPTWRWYKTPLRKVFLCSAATPPGGAVHGLCGYYAARTALRTLTS